MNKMIFESFWQADIALSAIQVAQSAYDQSEIDDQELGDRIAIVSGDLQLIYNSLKNYAINDIQKDPTKPVAS